MHLKLVALAVLLIMVLTSGQETAHISQVCTLEEVEKMAWMCVRKECWMIAETATIISVPMPGEKGDMEARIALDITRQCIGEECVGVCARRPLAM